MNYFLSLLIGYILGSINSSIIVSKLKKTDIRKHGSGNAGATNTLRTLGKGAAAVVVVFDILKGVLAVLLAKALYFDPYAMYAAGMGAILGHNFPVFFGFRGGKGILTSFAVILTLDWRVGVISLILAVAVIAATRFVSVGSMAGAFVLPILGLLFGDAVFTGFCVIVTVLAVWRHVPNIKRLASGEEHKLGEGVKNGG